jgi:NAD(P)-dependent dehydrogenase (short-subunit alcohol dehydrogenase family)
MLIEDKVAIITGAAGELGSVVTKAFLENGAKVVALYHSEDKLEELYKFLGDLQDNLVPFHGDATVEEEMKALAEQAVEEFGRIDILVNIVGGWKGGSTLDKTSMETWDYMLELNLKTCFLSTKSVLPYMLDKEYGRIINISSRSGVQKGNRSRSGAYAVAKGGVLTFTEAVSEETKGKGINVNCIAPSTIDTQSNREMLPNADFSKWVKPEDIAKVIIFLSSDDCKPTSGALVPVYGEA